MTGNDGFISKGLNARGPSSLDALMGTLFIGAGLAEYKLFSTFKSITGEYDLPTILMTGIPLTIGVAGYAAIRYICANDRPSDNDNYNTSLISPELD